MATITETITRQLPLSTVTSRIPGTECGPYGQRLCIDVADELARKTPDRIYATVTKSRHEIAEGFKDVTIKQFANAVNRAAWEIDRMFGRSKTFGVIAYLGVSDIRYAIYLYAAIKTGYQVLKFLKRQGRLSARKEKS